MGKSSFHNSEFFNLLNKSFRALRNIEIESITLSEMTFTKFFPDDVNEKENLQKEEEKQNQPKNLVQLF